MLETREVRKIENSVNRKMGFRPKNGIYNNLELGCDGEMASFANEKLRNPFWGFVLGAVRLTLWLRKSCFA